MKILLKVNIRFALNIILAIARLHVLGNRNRESYDENIEQIKAIIGGNLNEVIAYLQGEMKKHAQAYRYEEANWFKEKIEILSRYQAKSTIVNPAIHNVDVFSIVSDENEAFVNFLKVVKGAVIQAHTVQVKKRLDEEDDGSIVFCDRGFKKSH